MTREQAVKGYNAGAMLLHWAIALAILFQLAVGFTMVRLDLLSDGLRFAVFQWHKTVGLLVLTLTIARIAWRVLNPPPAHAPMPAAEAALAGLVHGVLYALMLLVPLTGWAIVSASPTAIPTLLMMSESLPWPHLPLPDAWRGQAGEAVAESLHAWLAYGIAALLVLHVAGALKHSLLDRTPSLARILPLGGLPRQSTALLAIPLAAGLAAAFLTGGVAVGRSGGASVARAEDAPAAAPAAGRAGWTIDKARSSLRYEADFSGNTITGTIDRWDAAITFDPAALSSASADVSVDPASVTVSDPFVRSSIAGPDGFDVSANPAMTVRLDRFSAVADGFLAQGTVTIKGKTAAVNMPFRYSAGPDGSAHVTGTAVLTRLAFDLGAKNDPSGEWLGKTVKVLIDLQAAPRSDADQAPPPS